MSSYCENSFCDWNNTQYLTLQECHSNCAYYTLNNNPVPISKSDFVVLGAGAGILFGAVFLFALYKALISG